MKEKRPVFLWSEIGVFSINRKLNGGIDGSNIFLKMRIEISTSSKLYFEII